MVVIRVSGGAIQGASSDDPDLQVVVVDEDFIEAGDPHPFGSEEECAKILATMHPVY
jgi:hypothetical protein